MNNENWTTWNKILLLKYHQSTLNSGKSRNKSILKIVLVYVYYGLELEMSPEKLMIPNTAKFRGGDLGSD